MEVDLITVTRRKMIIALALLPVHGLFGGIADKCVMLNSGGPPMRIVGDGTTDGWVTCEWDGGTAEFPRQCLRAYSSSAA